MEIKSIVENLPYKIKDINLADSGRDAISISEKEMPGLMAVSYTHLTLPTNGTV